MKSAVATTILASIVFQLWGLPSYAQFQHEVGWSDEDSSVLNQTLISPDLEKWGGNVLPALEKETSIKVTGLNGTGPRPGFFFRGSGAEDFLLLWNDMPVNDVSSPTDAPNIQHLEKEFSHNIEILRGPEALRYGGSFSGVIRAKREANHSSRIRGELSTLQRKNLLLESSHEKFAVGGHYSSLSHWSLSARPPRGDDDFAEDFSVTGFSKLGMVSWAQNKTHDDDSGIEDPNADSREQSLQFATPKFTLSGASHQLRHQRIFRYSQNDLNAGSFTDFHSQNEGEKTQYSLDGKNSGLLLEHSALLGSGFNEAQDTIEIYSLMGQTFSSWLVKGGVRPTANFSQNQSSMGLNARLSIEKDKPEGFSPFAMIGTGTRHPSLYQRFSLYGQKDLRAQTSYEYEIGIQNSGDFRQKLSAFLKDYKDLINYDLVLSKYQNLQRVRIAGAEFEASLDRQLQHWKLVTTYLETRDVATGQELLRRPRWQGHLGWGYELKEDFLAQWVYHFLGSRWDVDPGGVRTQMGSFSTHEINLVWDRDAYQKWRFSIYNIANTSNEEISGYSSPPRTFSLQLEKEF